MAEIGLWDLVTVHSYDIPADVPPRPVLTTQGSRLREAEATEGEVGGGTALELQALVRELQSVGRLPLEVVAVDVKAVVSGREGRDALEVPLYFPVPWREGWMDGWMDGWVDG